MLAPADFQGGFDLLVKNPVAIRPVKLTDAAAYLHYTQNPEVYVPAAVVPPMNVAAARARLQEFVGGDEMYAVVFPESDQMIGDVGLYCQIAPDGSDDRFNRELGYELDPAFWGRGYMSAALAQLLNLGFVHLGVQRVKADVYLDNLASRHLLQKFGFKEATRNIELPPALKQRHVQLSEQFLDKTDWLSHY